MKIKNEIIEQARKVIRENGDLEYDLTYEQSTLKITYEAFLFIALSDVHGKTKDMNHSFESFTKYDETKETDNIGLYEAINMFLRKGKEND